MKFRQATNCCESVFQAAKLASANKAKQCITSQKFGSHYFWQIGNNVLSEGKSVLPPLFNDPEVLSSASDKATFLLKRFIGTRILMSEVSLYMLSFPGPILSNIIFL